MFVLTRLETKAMEKRSSSDGAELENRRAPVKVMHPAHQFQLGRHTVTAE